MPIYDVENRFSYYKSYSDNILVGPTRPTMGSYDWQRNVSGSVVSGSEEWRASRLLSDYVFKKANPFFRSGEVRYLRLSSAAQIIKDTITPSIVDLYFYGENESGTLVDTYNTNSPNQTMGFFIYFSRDGYPITASVSDDRINNIGFSRSFPYEKKYYNIPVFSNIFQKLDSVAVITNTSPTNKFINYYGFTHIFPNFEPFVIISLTKSGSVYNNQSIIIENFIEYTGSYDGSNFSTGQIGTFNGATFQSKSLPKKLIFGINPKSVFSNLSSSTTPALQNFLETYSTGAIIEGWKYGLYNGVPTNFSAVFRQNHYGQFRDMLEQRIYTKAYNNPLIGGPMDNNGGINFISGSALLGESNDYITASIYASDNVTEAYRVNPYGSGIFDKEYRASQPWYDNDPRVGT